MAAFIKNLSIFTIGAGLGMASLELAAAGFALFSFYYAELSEG